MALPTIKTPFTSRKSVYEAAIERRRKQDEDYRHRWVENANYFQTATNKAQLMAKWTSENSFNNSMNSFLNDCEMEKVDVAMRKKKIHSLYEAERSQQDYEVMQLRQPENRKTLEQLRKKADELDLKRKQELNDLAKLKYDQHFEQNDLGMREIKRKIDADETQQMWQEQINVTNKRERELREQEAMQAEMARTKAEQDHWLEVETIRKDAELELARAATLQQQIAEIRKREEESRMLQAEEEELMRQQQKLDNLDSERKTLEVQRVARGHGRALLKQHNAALRRKCQEMQAELERDLTWLARVEAEDRFIQRKHDSQQILHHAELSRAKELLEQQLRMEKTREAEIDQLFIQEAKEMWAKREAEWQMETQAREKLLKEVLLQRQEQIFQRLNCNRRQQIEDIDERERLVEQLERVRLATDLAEENARVKREQLQRDLLKQAHVNSKHQSYDEFPIRGKNMLADDAERLAEQAYERRLRKQAMQLREQANSSVISGRPFNHTLSGL